MNPALIMTIIQAATMIAGPAFQVAMVELATVQADQAKHATALQTFLDAIGALTTALAPKPPATPAA